MTGFPPTSFDTTALSFSHPLALHHKQRTMKICEGITGGGVGWLFLLSCCWAESWNIRGTLQTLRNFPQSRPSQNLVEPSRNSSGICGNIWNCEALGPSHSHPRLSNPVAACRTFLTSQNPVESYLRARSRPPHSQEPRETLLKPLVDLVEPFVEPYLMAAPGYPGAYLG